ncbi:uncharacterized protein [Linepithema humile]|uniref:uncharacterized protein n=1 Tax=Linepithema humile TaxID=83485 RepID=UPI00351F0475
MTVKRISNNQKNISNGVTCKSGQKRKNEINLSIQPKPKQLKSDAKNDDPYLNVKDRQSTSIIVDVLASTIDNASRGKIIDVTGKTWTLIKQINDNKADPQLDNIQSKKKDNSREGQYKIR